MSLTAVHSDEIIGISEAGGVHCNWDWASDERVANAKAMVQCKENSGPKGSTCILLMSDDALADWATRILKNGALLSTCASCATDVPQVPGADGLLPYAHAKRKAPEITSRDELKYYCWTRFPNRGLVVSYGSFLGRAATFYTVDIDKKSLRRIFINANMRSMDAQHPLDTLPVVVWADESVQLSPNELNPLIKRMNQIWRDGVPYKVGLQPMDSTSDLLLLDGRIAFDDQGRSDHAPDAVLTEAVMDLAREHGLTRDNGAPTSETCDPNPSP